MSMFDHDEDPGINFGDEDAFAGFLPDPNDPAILRSTAMFNRVLASWASDLLHLRREGLAIPGWRERVDDEDGIGWRRAA